MSLSILLYFLFDFFYNQRHFVVLKFKMLEHEMLSCCNILNTINFNYRFTCTFGMLNIVKLCHNCQF